MVEIFLAFLGSICPGVIYNVEKRNLMWLVSAVCWGGLPTAHLMKLRRVLYLHLFGSCDCRYLQ